MVDLYLPILWFQLQELSNNAEKHWFFPTKFQGTDLYVKPVLKQDSLVP